VPARHRRTASVLSTLVLCVILVLLPLAISSLLWNALPADTPVHRLAAWPANPPAVRATVHLDVLALDEWQETLAIQVTAHQTCLDACPWGDRYTLVAVFGDRQQPAWARTASATVTLPAASRDVSQLVTLPLAGDPVHYPFDRYHLGLGILLERVAADGSVVPVSGADGRDYLAVSLQGRVPRMYLEPPVLLDPVQVQPADPRAAYQLVTALTFRRPVYLQVLTVLLVLLVTAAAAYAVLLRPLNDLFVNAGALVLGIWGIRTILLGSGLTGVTAVDLTLSLVIFLLLAAIGVRGLWRFEAASDLWWLRRLTAGRAVPAALRSPSLTNQSAAAPADHVPGAGRTERADIDLPNDHPTARRRGSASAAADQPSRNRTRNHTEGPR
jgi:hypothetical protein